MRKLSLIAVLLFSGLHSHAQDSLRRGFCGLNIPGQDSITVTAPFTGATPRTQHQLRFQPRQLIRAVSLLFITRIEEPVLLPEVFPIPAALAQPDVIQCALCYLTYSQYLTSAV